MEVNMSSIFEQIQQTDLDYIIVKTTSYGPFAEDLFFLIKAGEKLWEIPHSQSEGIMKWFETIPNLNYLELIKSMGCVSDHLFVIYRKSGYPALDEETLLVRLEKFLSRISTMDPEQINKVKDKLLFFYESFERTYHNLEHIHQCLWELDQVNDFSLDKATVELAIWFHDLVYDPTSKKNEERSQSLMKQMLSEFVNTDILDRASQIILGETLSLEGLIFHDIDFAILGQSTVDYQIYLQNIMEEFIDVPRIVFYIRRKKLLKGLLKDKIYLTETFNERYEESAIANINRELEKWPYRVLPAL